MSETSNLKRLAERFRSALAPRQVPAHETGRFFVWCPTQGLPSVPHMSEIGAEEQAVALCKRTGHEFFVIEVRSAVRPAEVTIDRASRRGSLS